MKNYIDLFVGGAFSGMAKAMKQDSVGAFIDAKSEIERDKEILKVGGNNDCDQKVFALVPGETFHGLLSRFEGLNHPFIVYGRKQPNTQLETGLAQEKLCGYLAVKRAESQGLKDFLEHLYSDLFKSENGTHGEVGIRIWAGLPGGTGPNVAQRSAELLGEIVGGKSGRPTTLNLIRVGAVSYEGLGDRIWDNAAAALLEDFVWDLSLCKRKEEVRRLILLELPTVSTEGHLIENDKETRDQLALQVAQALCSSGVKEVLDRRNPNLDLSPSGFGTIRLLQVDWFHGISPRHIVFSAAHLYKSRLEAFNFDVTTHLSDAITIPQIKVEVYPTQEYIKSAKQLADSLLDSTSLNRSEFVNQAKAIRSFAGQVLLEYQFQRRKESIKQDLENPQSVIEFIRSLQHLLGIIEAIQTQIQYYQAEKAEVQNSLSEAEKRLKTALDLWYPVTLGTKLRSAISSVAGKLNALEQAIDLYRLEAEKLAKVGKAIETLEGTLLVERREFEAYKNRPLRLKENLTAILGQSADTDRLINLDWFNFRVLDEVFPELLSNRNDIEALRHLLCCKCSHFIRPEGLAKIVNVTADVSPERILSSLLDGEPKYRGPHWGSSNPTGNPEETILILPPVNRATSDELNEALRRTQRGKDTHCIAQAESFVAGANILILRVYKVSHSWEVITQPYFYRIQTMDHGRFFVDWEGMMKEPRWKQIYEELCQHYQLDEVESGGKRI